MTVTKDGLRLFPFLRSLDEGALLELASQVTEREYPTDATIFPDGEVGDTFYLLKRGHVEIFKPTPEGEVVLNDMRQGDSFGEMSLLDGQPRSAAARAAGQVNLLEIPKEVFLSLINRFPALLYLTALENSQRLRRSDQELIAELRARNQELQQLYETSLDISRHLELDEALHAIAGRTRQLLTSSGSALHLYDPGRNLLVAQSPHKNVRPGEGATGRVFAEGLAVIANAETEARRVDGRRKASICALAAPISLENNKLGTLTAYRPHDGKPYTQDDAQLLLLLANQAAVAIENARLFRLSADKGRLDGELNAAREVQRSLIPTRPPRIPGFQLTGLWTPAREVSGDFYDYIPLGHGRLGIVVGDVSDKGAPAALYMAISRSVLRASVILEPDPERAIERSNRVLASDAAKGMFVTLFFGVLDSQRRRLTYVNAGHNPPILLKSRSGRLQRLSRHGLALGIDAESHWASQTIDLSKGDLLVLYTDGVTEAFNQRDEMFGEGRLNRIIRKASGDTAHGLVRSIDKAVRDFVGSLPLADDVTLVVLKASK